MDYAPLQRINPSQIDVTVNSSIWFCSRLKPGKGNSLISFPHYRQINNRGMRTCNNADLMIGGLLGMNDNEQIINLESSAGSLSWKGLWTINNQPIIGRGHSTAGLVCPMNTHNAGRRYKLGWRPSIVN